MAFNPLPKTFFGASYALASSAVSLVTATDTTGITVGTTFVGAASTNVITTAAVHGLLVGDRVRCVAGTGALPTGISAATDYYVLTVPSTTTLTLSATRGGTVLDLTADGGTDHLLKSMGPLDELTDTEADPTSTGDWRKILFALMEMLYYKWSGLATADKPTKVSVSRSATVNNLTNEVTRNYTVRITLSPPAAEVASE